MSASRGRPRRRVPRREAHRFPPRPEYRDLTGVVLDFLPAGYYDDPHPHHRDMPVAQILGATYFSLVDGVPLEGELEFLNKVTISLEVTVRAPLEGGAVTRVRLACIPGPERRLICFVADDVPEEFSDVIASAFPHPENVDIIHSYESFLDIVRGRGLPEKVVMAPHTGISYRDLTPTARENLEEAVKLILRENEEFFVNFFNVAEPINVRLHAIELLRGVGKKTLQRLLMERQRRPFKSYEEVKKVLKIDPVEALAEKILEEIRGEARYYLFVQPPPEKRGEAIFLDYSARIKRYLRQRGG